MPRYLVIRSSDNLVENAVEWNGDVTRWTPPAGRIALLSAQGQPGDTWDGAVGFQAPAPRPDPDAARRALLTSLDTILADAAVTGRLRELGQALRLFYAAR